MNKKFVEPKKEDIVFLTSGTKLRVTLRKNGFLTGEVIGESNVTLYVPEEYTKPCKSVSTRPIVRDYF